MHTGLLLAAGEFFGAARLAAAGAGVEVAHRIAQGAPESVVTHTHADAHFILVSGGEYVSSAAGRATPGEATLIYNPPGTTHRDHFVRGRGSFFSVSVAPATARTLLAGLRTPDEARYLASLQQHTCALALAACCARDSTPLQLESLCAELIGTLEPGAARVPRPRPHWHGVALELLQDRYREELSIADIAGAAGVHPVYLARSFRRHYRCTPATFARFRRLEAAAALVAGTTATLADIAQASGFADQSQLNRAFRRGFGLTPGEYRGLLGGSRRLQIDKTCPARWAKVGAPLRPIRTRARSRR